MAGLNGLRRTERAAINPRRCRANDAKQKCQSLQSAENAVSRKLNFYDKSIRLPRQNAHHRTSAAIFLRRADLKVYSC
ncbi:hypothetical protein TNCV_4648551 [Trichonephila clavipes]|uniref:Uncharacterized protein n=1 Tax=Trichonephila clavipes TaxID=2585209 RepID=A0A8X6T6B9_TRICX|nr:hypothetical protein TNCV_4648551 [Trichonephila clavipes]